MVQVMAATTPQIVWWRTLETFREISRSYLVCELSPLVMIISLFHCCFMASRSLALWRRESEEGSRPLYVHASTLVGIKECGRFAPTSELTESPSRSYEKNEKRILKTI